MSEVTEHIADSKRCVHSCSNSRLTPSACGASVPILFNDGAGIEGISDVRTRRKGLVSHAMTPNGGGGYIYIVNERFEVCSLRRHLGAIWLHEKYLPSIFRQSAITDVSSRSTSGANSSRKPRHFFY